MICANNATQRQKVQPQTGIQSTYGNIHIYIYIYIYIYTVYSRPVYHIILYKIDINIYIPYYDLCNNATQRQKVQPQTGIPSTFGNI